MVPDFLLFTLNDEVVLLPKTSAVRRADRERQFMIECKQNIVRDHMDHPLYMFGADTFHPTYVPLAGGFYCSRPAAQRGYSYFDGNKRNSRKQSLDVKCDRCKNPCL